MSMDDTIAKWARQKSVPGDVAAEVHRLAEASGVSDPGNILALGRLVLEQRRGHKNTQRDPEARPTPTAMERLCSANRANAQRDMRAERKRRNGR